MLTNKHYLQNFIEDDDILLYLRYCQTKSCCINSETPRSVGEKQMTDRKKLIEKKEESGEKVIKKKKEIIQLKTNGDS